MNAYERYAPFIILFLLFSIILILKDFIRYNSKLEKNIRLVFSFITGITISFYYIGNWLILGVDINNLPFHLCYIGTILSIILALNKNKKIFNFLLVCGVIGGLSSFIAIARGSLHDPQRPPGQCQLYARAWKKEASFLAST